MPIDNRNFADYVRELREVSATNRVPYGATENLRDLLARLKSSPLFFEDFSSMIRATVLREQMDVTTSELLILVTVAWGGESVDQPLEAVQPVLLELGTLIDEQRRKAGKFFAFSEAPAAVDDAEPETFAAQANPTIPIDVEGIRSGFDGVTGVPSVPDATAPAGEESPPPAVADRPSSNHARAGIAVDREAEKSGEEPDDHLPARKTPRLTEVLTLGLLGMVIGLLVTVRSLPVYRAHVSVLLASPGVQKRVGANNGDLLQNGALPERIANDLILQPHPNPMFRQDVLSRGMRDLGIGGRETILYANVVADTARRVKVQELQPGLFELTCDSWSPKLSVRFCNAVADAMREKAPAEPSSDTVKVDEAAGVGVQVFPYWYMQSAAGFALGSFLGVLVGFRHSRPEDEDAS